MVAVWSALRRSGSQFDPELAAILRSDAEAILGGLDSAGRWEAMIGAEPSLGVRLAADEFDAALLTVANFVLNPPLTQPNVA